MKKYYVNLPGGTKDSEFQQVVDLLISRGVKQDDSREYRRVRQTDGSLKEEGFLYLFDDRSKAEEFAVEIGRKTGQPSWLVFEVDVESIQDLIEQHRELKDEPLILAMQYDAGAEPDEIYLLEVIDNFGANGISSDRELFEVTFPKASGPDGGPDQTWHLVLTNPLEFDVALREGWEQADKIRRAVGSGRYEVVFMTSEEGVRNLDLIHE